MELRNVRAFVAVADERHFGRAASSLNLTQPALSLRIQVLERELGIQLLRRNAREVHLTPAGEALLVHAKALVQEEDRALREMKDHVAGLAGRLRIAYLNVWNLGLPPRIVAEFRRRYPAVRLETTSGNSHLNAHRVMEDEVDFAFVGVPAGSNGEVVVRTIDRQEVVLVMTAANHLAAMQTVPIECLRGEPIIAVTLSAGSLHVSGGRRWLATHLREEPNIVAEEPMDQVPSALVHSGVAVTLMTADRAALWAGEGLVWRRVSPTPIVEYGVAYLKSATSPVLLKMLGIVDEIAPALPDQLPEGTEPMWSPPELDKIPWSTEVG
ncbi:MAG TPA: LysR family transcriptional regulator [Candidatus Dormibacteraeota bacterium]|nr:LysR family transcriptional regulator [Candidatus Dormibacteraeota bacterium]